MSAPVGEFDINSEIDLSPLCEAEFIQMLGSKEYFNDTMMGRLVYIELKDLLSPIKKVGDRCVALDVRVDKQLRPVPAGTELDIVGPFECFEKTGTKDVGKMKRPLSGRRQTDRGLDFFTVAVLELSCGGRGWLVKCLTSHSFIW